MKRKAKIKKEELDPLFGDALGYFLDKGAAEIPALQRRFSLGYARAAALVDQMEKMGYVSEFRAEKPREVLIPRAKFRRYRRRGVYRYRPLASDGAGDKEYLECLEACVRKGDASEDFLMRYTSDRGRAAEYFRRMQDAGLVSGRGEVKKVTITEEQFEARYAVRETRAEDDETFSRAVEIALETGSVSTGLLRGRLMIGLVHAERIITRMEEAGYFDPDREGREMLLTRDEWERARAEGEFPVLAKRHSAAESDGAAIGEHGSGENDPLFLPSVRFAAASRVVSEPMLQKRFQMSASRAARILKGMERLGYVMPSQKGMERAVILTVREFDRIYGNVE